MFCYWIDKLPLSDDLSRGKVKAQRSGALDLIALYLKKEDLGEVFLREDFENILRSILFEIKKKKESRDLSFKDLASFLFSPSRSFEILENDAQDADKTSSLYKFMKQPDIKAKKPVSSSYLKELTVAIIKKKQPSGDSLYFLSDQAKNFLMHIEKCLMIDKFSVISTMDFKSIENQIDDNYFFKQLSISFMESFESAISSFGKEPLKFINRNNKLVNSRVYFENSPRYQTTSDLEIEGMLDSLSGAIVNRIQKSESSMPLEEKNELRLFLSKVSLISESIENMHRKKREIYSKLFTSIKSSLESYEEDCKELKINIGMPFIESDIRTELFSSKEMSLIVGLKFKQDECFNDILPPWENIIPFPGRDILFPIISHQINLRQNAESFFNLAFKDLSGGIRNKLNGIQSIGVDNLADSLIQLCDTAILRNNENPSSANNLIKSRYRLYIIISNYIADNIIFSATVWLNEEKTKKLSPSEAQELRSKILAHLDKLCSSKEALETWTLAEKQISLGNSRDILGSGFENIMTKLKPYLLKELKSY
jgi:hypothetical protein